MSQCFAPHLDMILETTTVGQLKIRMQVLMHQHPQLHAQLQYLSMYYWVCAMKLSLNAVMLIYGAISGLLNLVSLAFYPPPLDFST